jgi:hypothetical protein
MSEKYMPDLKEIKHGAPQGSSLDPVLILVCINNLTISMQGAEAVLFADDANI